MSAAPASPLSPVTGLGTAAARPAEAVEEAHALTEQLSRELGIPTASTLLESVRVRPVGPVLSALFARGGLPRGEVVTFSGRHVLSLALACCAETTAEGGWCAGIGLGEPAVAALEGLGLELNRFVCLDTPAQDWLRVASILMSSFSVLVVAPGFIPSAGERARLEAKLRESSVTLLMLDEAHAAGGPLRTSSGPGRTERIAVLEESWEGLEPSTGQHGSGRLWRRTLHLHSARTGEHRITLPDARGRAGHAGSRAHTDSREHAGSTDSGHVPAGTLRLVR